MDIHSLLERPRPATAPDNVSSEGSRRSSDGLVVHKDSRAAQEVDSDEAPTSSKVMTRSLARQPSLGAKLQTDVIRLPRSPPPPYVTMPPARLPAGYQSAHHHIQPYPSYQPSYLPTPVSDPRLPPPFTLNQHVGSSHKRMAAQHPHPSESPAKKKQSKWTSVEDASIIDLRGNGMKWEDISKHLPGRSAISCRLRFQNYLERRSEWDEEKKNKLARLYER